MVAHESVLGCSGVPKDEDARDDPTRSSAGPPGSRPDGETGSRKCLWVLRDAKDDPTRLSAGPPPGYWPYGGTGSLVELELVGRTVQVRPYPRVAEGLGEASEVSRNWVVRL